MVFGIPINELSAWLEENLGLTPVLQGRLIQSLLVILIIWVLNRSVLGIVRRRASEPRQLYTWQKTIGYITLVFILFWVGQIWFEGFRNLATYLGLLSAGLAIALRDLIVDFVGWIFILWSRPFAVGDRIQVGTTSGDVIDLRLFSFSVLEIGNWVHADQSTGRVIHIPNGRVFSHEIANYETGFQYIWNEISVNLTLDSDWKRAKVILQNIANKHAEHLSDAAEERVKQASRRYMIYYNKMTPIVYTALNEKGVELTVRYLCEPRQRRNSADAIWEDILQVFAERDDIRLAL